MCRPSQPVVVSLAKAMGFCYAEFPFIHSDMMVSHSCLGVKPPRQNSLTRSGDSDIVIMLGVYRHNLSWAVVTMLTAAHRRRLGAFIRHRREALTMTQAELGDLADVDAGYVAHLENGRNVPTLKVLMRLARALQVTLGEALTEAGFDSFADSDINRKIMARLHGEPESVRRAILEMWPVVQQMARKLAARPAPMMAGEEPGEHEEGDAS